MAGSWDRQLPLLALALALLGCHASPSSTPAPRERPPHQAAPAEPSTAHEGDAAVGGVTAPPTPCVLVPLIGAQATVAAGRPVMPLHVDEGG
jgi:hypothetical protein